MTTVAEIVDDDARRAGKGATTRRRRATTRVARDDAREATYTAAEVARHARADDCWVIVRGGVYDVTRFVPRHPGGNMIYVKAGGECTALFDSYHPERARATLEKYRIGALRRDAGEREDEDVVEYLKDDLREGEFYADCKAGAAKYFKDNKLDPRVHWEMYAKTLVILTGVVVGHYGSFFAPSASFAAALALAVLHGTCKAEVGVSIQHDANHGAYGNNRTWLHAMQLTLDVVGASSFMWKQQHVAGHHAYTNVEGIDPDIRCSEKDVRRVNEHQPHEPYHRVQHVYLALMYGLLSFKSCFVDDFNAFFSGRIGWVKVMKFTRGEAVAFWGSKLAWAFYYLYLPAKYSHRSIGQLLALWTVTEFVTGWLLAFMFQVAHVVGDVHFFQLNEKNQLNKGWGEAQLMTSADFAHGSKFWTHFSGGLNYQVVHHLFPGVCHVHYPALAPIIKTAADKHGLHYQIYPTFWSALRAHFTHLARVGQKAYVPSLQTVG
jgi:fatty acid desaturase/cytochrome b involved in lipid metabolism